VVALSSITGVYPEAGLAAYGATKAALRSLVATLNAEESGRGVCATAIAPGYVETDMSAWVTDRVPAEQMIPVADIVGLVESLVSLSARSVVAEIVVSRAGAPAFIA
jgi:NAD(P)-dependent dehydrogenase (short-subunit alcohol dehydrogenase family)